MSESSNHKAEAAEFLRTQVKQAERERAIAVEERDAIREQMKALIQEFTESDNKETPEKLRKNLRGRIAIALGVVDEVLAGAAGKVQAAAMAKFVIAQGLVEVDGDNPAGELAKLLERLSDEPTNVTQ